ncbi:unnamed protein product [Clonostachys rosea f. rosea IK726]|uniref:Uncharacterized protein n=1 Tax=Clonostachys rosea f. rosea IK726 TaxID=1349383 RepID=A0ACA9T5V4_BIOOC|nr:unnamed protein product [Clonostachys rosea f. rosea IK726]
MVTLKHLSVTAVLWLGLASRGLGQSLDKPDDLAIRSENAEDIVARDIDLGLEERDEDDELETRDIEDELVEIRDFEDDLLEARDFDEELLEARDLYFLLLLLLLLPTAEDAAISIISRLVISTSVSVTLPLARLLFLFPVLDLDRFLPRPPPHLQTATAATEGSRTRMSR